MTTPSGLSTGATIEIASDPPIYLSSIYQSIRLDDVEKRAWVLPSENEEAAWQRLPLTCLFSKQRLREPARGNLCRHSATRR